jgi:hypothetical protein
MEYPLSSLLLEVAWNVNLPEYLSVFSHFLLLVKFIGVGVDALAS